MSDALSRLRVDVSHPSLGRSAASRARVLSAVREMLEEGAFHSSTVEEVADRAGVSRATLYQHFGTRLGLIDATCDLLAESRALAGGVSARPTRWRSSWRASWEFWASEERLLVALYGVVAVDPAARAFVERQRRDRYSEVRRVLAVNGREAGFAAFATLTSFETYLELRRNAGLSKRDVVATLQRLASA